MKIAWISYFPIEWLPDLPEPLRELPRQHPATWQRVLLEEFSTRPELELHIFAVRKRLAKNLSFRRGNAVFHCIKVPHLVRTATVFWWETLFIRQKLKRIKPDLVHAWGTERAAALVASRLPYPYLVTMQGLLQWYSEQVELGPMLNFEARLERPALRRASIVTTESAFGVAWLREHYPHLNVLQVEHAPSWVFHRVRRVPQKKKIRFFFSGPLAPIKGGDLLVAAMDRLRTELDFEFVWVGGGKTQYVEKVKAVTSPATWERIVFRTNLSPTQMAEELARATMVLFPTRVDTSPNTVKEAVVLGVPVIASRVGGIPDYVVPRKNGLLFSPGNLDAFLAAIREAIHHPLFSQGNVDLDTLAEKQQYLSPAAMTQKFLAAYQTVLNRG